MFFSEEEASDFEIEQSNQAKYNFHLLGGVIIDGGKRLATLNEQPTNCDIDLAHKLISENEIKIKKAIKLKNKKLNKLKRKQ